MRIILVVLIVLSGQALAEEEPLVTLHSNFIGDKEQPLVSYFIPWNDIGTPDKLRWDIDSKNDKTLEIVDRQVLLRTSSMYTEMKLEKNLINVDEAL